ncbi:MAG: hypothetical protein OHK005_16790 [Candidatus Methylacidiphilales bacterium]
MPFLLDSSVLLPAPSGQAKSPPALSGEGEDECFLSSATAAELLETALLVQDPERRSLRIAFVEALLEQFPLLPIDRRVARMHAQMRAGPLPRHLRPQDGWVAATSLAYGFTLATARPADFKGIPGLRLVDWSL